MGMMTEQMKWKLLDESMQKQGPWIETFLGKRFYFLNPTIEQVHIRDIAHALAYTCRYTGHCSKFYSVAEHSIYVSYLANDPLAGLLHDASEAYITDIASPVKQHLGGYIDMENNIMRVVAKKFGFDFPLSEDIKDCDNTQLKTEAKYLLKSKGNGWAHEYPTKRKHGIAPQCMSPEYAEKAFLDRFEEVRNDWNSSDDFWDKGINCIPLFDRHEPIYRYPSAELFGGEARNGRLAGSNSHCGEDSRSDEERPRLGTEGGSLGPKAVGGR